MKNEKNKKRGFRKYLPLIIATVLVIVLGLSVVKYFTDVHKAEGHIVSPYFDKKTEGVKVSYIDEGIFVDSEETTDRAVIYYPGCKIEYQAYIPFCYELAKEGFDVFIVPVKMNFALFDKQAGQKVMDKYDYDSWILMGHSMGGIAISSFADEKGDEVDGLVLLGAHGTADLTDTDIVTLVMYGSEDGVVQRKKVEAGRTTLAKEGNYHELEIPGANHANWGNYGTQAMDGEAGIPQEEQFRIGIAEIVKYFNK